MKQPMQKVHVNVHVHVSAQRRRNNAYDFTIQLFMCEEFWRMVLTVTINNVLWKLSFFSMQMSFYFVIKVSAPILSYKSSLKLKCKYAYF